MRTRSRLRRLSDQDGAGAVEFAIVAPLLFMLIFGIIQFGIFFAQDLALSNAARQAARAAAVPATGNCAAIFAEAQQGAQTIALDTTYDGSADFDMEVFTPVDGSACSAPYEAVDEPCLDEAPGSEVIVEVSANARLAIPLFGDLGVIPLTREGSYRCEFS